MKALMPRELQVLNAIAEGRTSKQIAFGMAITLKTVLSHRLRAMQKIEAHNAADVCRWALNRRKAA